MRSGRERLIVLGVGGAGGVGVCDRRAARYMGRNSKKAESRTRGVCVFVFTALQAYTV